MNVREVDSGSDQGWYVNSTGNGINFGWICGLTSGHATYNYSVNSKEHGGPRGLNHIYVGGDCMRGMLFLDVTKYANMLCVHRATVSQQAGRACFNQTFISHMRKDK